jgi:hypothetical protein
VKPVTPPTRISRSANGVATPGRTRHKPIEPAVLGRSTPKDPAREQARREARDRDIKPTRSSTQDRLGKVEADQPETKSENPRAPSRTSRSMKSRQSEPRVSRSGAKRKSKSRPKTKPPYALMAIAAILVIAGLIMLPRAYRSSGRSAAQVRVSVTDAQTRGPRTSAAALTTRTQEIQNGATLITAQVQANQKPAMNLTPARQIRLEQIVGFTGGITPVIEFRDGSRLNADPVVMEQLPAEVRFQMTYTQVRK